MLKQAIQIRAVSNVAASKTALIDLPIGPRYHQIILQHGFGATTTNTIAQTFANISEIRVKVNGRVQRVMSGTQLRDMNLLNGTGYDAVSGEIGVTAPGVSIPIFFAEPWRQDKVDQDALAWPSSGWNTFQIECDLGAYATPTLTAGAIIDTMPAPQGKPVGIVKWLRHQFAAAGAAFDITTLDRRDWLQQISLYPDSGGSNTASEVDLRINGSMVREFIYAQNLALLNQNGMTPKATGRTATIFDMVLDHDGLLGSAINLQGVGDLTLTIKAGGTMSQTITAILQKLGPPE